MESLNESSFFNKLYSSAKDYFSKIEDIKIIIQKLNEGKDFTSDMQKVIEMYDSEFKIFTPQIINQIIEKNINPKNKEKLYELTEKAYYPITQENENELKIML